MVLVAKKDFLIGGTGERVGVGEYIMDDLTHRRIQAAKTAGWLVESPQQVPENLVRRLKIDATPPAPRGTPAWTRLRRSGVPLPNMTQTLTSKRGLPLILAYGIPLNPTVTVEFYEKWYELFVVMPNGNVEAMPFPDEPEFCPGESPYVDHVPNPRVVAAWARSKGYDIDPLAYEMMIGRWEIEARNNYTAEVLPLRDALQ